MVEERATTNQIGTSSFGTPLAIVSTEGCLKTCERDEKYAVDESNISKLDYLILIEIGIGMKINGAGANIMKMIALQTYSRDRDQAFSKYDGALVYVLMKTYN
jgi:hypothetical protein